MRTTSRIARLMLLFALAMSSCAMNVSNTDTESEEREVGNVEQAVQGGTVTLLRPEVGGQGCTFTLITSRLFLTAAHCGGHRRSKSAGTRSDSSIQTDARLGGTSTGSTRSAPSSRAAHGSDLAIGRLTEPITDMTPATMQTVLPAPGAPVTFVGYGCTDPSNPAQGAAIKRYREGTFAKTSFGCPGDSGGPLFTGNFAANGPMISVMSGQGDVYAHIGHHSERLAATIRKHVQRSRAGVRSSGRRRSSRRFALMSAGLRQAVRRGSERAARSRFTSPSKTCQLKAAMFPLVPAADYISGVPGVFSRHSRSTTPGTTYASHHQHQRRCVPRPMRSAQRLCGLHERARQLLAEKRGRGAE